MSSPPEPGEFEGCWSLAAASHRRTLILCSGLPAEFPCGRPSAPACTPFCVLRNGLLCGFPLFVLGSFLHFHLPWGHRPHSSWGLAPAAHEGTSQTMPFWVPGLLRMAPRGRSPPCVVTLHSSHWAKQPFPSPMAADGSLETLPCQWVLGFRPPPPSQDFLFGGESNRNHSLSDQPTPLCFEFCPSRLALKHSSSEMDESGIPKQLPGAHEKGFGVGRGRNGLSFIFVTWGSEQP